MHTIKYMPQTQVMAVEFAQLYNPHGYNGRLTAFNTQYSVSHYIGSRVNTYYNPVPFAQ